ncbi:MULTISPECIES: ABC transporter permease [unclassified Kosmotoga]|uniref:ABC transporter permease n=1 Tax=unclassified Kosmotoga TaxID=2631489 RepID=UPI0007C565CF|nr:MULTISPECIES: ABC transporter permease [unclassified Kosmotoga]MDI3523516.1 peptide/nickel transport system permease protein [Kosmotoga sp.]MDK2952942.1 peptide/nickel transport system permease protein [Kosmotoga sp.]OAA20140.1 ABC transporter substrate-binding protein [Kosmotoga sp. DU53]
MLRYILRRLILAVPVLLGVSILSFIIISLAPGDFLDNYRLNPSISAEQVKLLEKQFGFDKPIIVQYFKWLGQVLKGNFGYSFVYHVPVFSIIWRRLGATLLLSISTMIFIWGIAIPLGIYSALHQYSFNDQLFSFLAFIGISIPNFFFALLWLYMSAKTGWFPIGGIISNNYDQFTWWRKILDYLWHVIGPVVTLGTSGLAGLMRQMRGQLLDQLRQDYVLFARAKGMPEDNVIYKHAVRNAINPIVTMFGYALAGLLGGAVLTETVFGWPGMGRLVIEALTAQDLFMVMASLLLSSLLLIAGNLVADLLLAWVDPRIRFRLR